MITTCRYKAIDGWRFLFALLIVWHHMPGVEGRLHEFGFSAVSFFFILSGYLSLNSNTSNPKIYYTRKFFRIFPVYWMALLIALVETVPIRSFWKIQNVDDILMHVFLLQAWSDNPQNYYLNAPMWFLSALLFFYILLPWLQTLLKRFPVSFTISTFLYMFFVLFPIKSYTDGLCLFNIRACLPLVRLPEFLLGMVLAYWLQRITLPSLHRISSFLLLVAMFLIAPYVPIVYFRSYCVIPVMAYLVVAYVKAEKSVLDVFSKWGGQMEIYVFHGLVITAIIRFMSLTNLHFPNYVIILLVYLLTFTVAHLYIAYIQPYINKLETNILKQIL